MRKNKGLIIGGLGLLLIVSACHETKEGEENKVGFTPVQCGPGDLQCDLDDPIGLGGTISIKIEGLHGTNVTGFDVEAGDKSVLFVSKRPPSENGNVVLWDVMATGIGEGWLLAKDGREEVDRVKVHIEEVTSFKMLHFLDQLTPDTDEPGLDQVWDISVGSSELFVLANYTASLERAMGRYLYEIDMTDDFKKALNNTCLAASGYFELKFSQPGIHDIEIWMGTLRQVIRFNVKP